MGQSKSGARKAADKLLAKDPDHYRKLAKKAHAAYLAQHPDDRKPRGFGKSKQLASEAGKKSRKSKTP